MMYYYMPYVDQIDNLYISALDSVWLGTATPEDAINSVYNEVQAITDKWAAEKAEIAG